MVKYSGYWKEQSKKYKKELFRSENWEYNKEQKYYVCPQGRKLSFRETKQKKSHSGYPIQADRYECESCKYCRMKKLCSPAKGNRTIERNERWLRLKRKAQRILEDVRYKELRKQRSVEVETVFGQIKGNQGYRRFLLRGTDKVSTEWGLLAFGYNIKRLHRLKWMKSG